MTLFTATLVWRHDCKETAITHMTHTPWLEAPGDPSNIGGKIIVQAIMYTHSLITFLETSMNFTIPKSVYLSLGFGLTQPSNPTHKVTGVQNPTRDTQPEPDES